MKVAIDFTAVKTTGALRYYGGFMPAFAKSAENHQIVIYGSRSCAGVTLPENCEIKYISESCSTLKRLYWGQVFLPRLLAEDKCDVFFAPFDIGPVSGDCAMLLGVRNPTSALLSLNYQVKESKTYLKIHRIASQISAKKANLVFFPSQYASDTLGDLLNVPSKKRAVVYHGCDPCYWAIEKDSKYILEKLGVVRKKYFLFVSNFYRYKHADTFIYGFREFLNKIQSTDFKAVLVGNSSDGDSEIYLEMIRDLGLEGRFVFASKILDDELRALYQNSAAFVFPSLMETFGQPLVEALNAGSLVIAADTAFARELCAESAIYFPPLDYRELGECLMRVSNDPELVSRMTVTGRRRGQAFTWDREARGTLDLLLRLNQ